MSYQHRRAPKAAPAAAQKAHPSGHSASTSGLDQGHAPAGLGAATSGPGGLGFGSNSARARQLGALGGSSQAMLDAQAGDVDALLGGWSSFAPSLELTEDSVYGASAAQGALTAAMRDPAFAECAFGESTRDLRDAPHLLVEGAGHAPTAAELSGLTAAQLLAGLQAEGWSDTTALEDVWAEHIDSEGLYLNEVTLLTTGERFEWLEFFMGDTEVGYLFRAGTTELVGCVGDGEIYDCAVRLPPGA